MNSPIPIRAPLALLMILVLSLSGCFGGGESENDVPISGDPEADLRAEQRVGGGDDDNGGGDDDRTLYERLGGSAGITRLVEDMTARVIADPRVNFERRNVRTNWLGGRYKPWDPTPERIERFKRHMVQFLSLSTGGPARYDGFDMRTVHKDMQITNQEFDAMVGDIKASMDKLGFANREQRDLLAIIETTRKQIVEEN